MSKCYGCGKELRSYDKQGYYWLAGEQRSFCHGRYGQPKRPCLTRATAKLDDDHLCHFCGEGWSSHGEPCSKCYETFALGRRTRQRTTSLRLEIVSEILATFLRFNSWGDENMAWPFAVVTRKGDEQRDLSRGLRQAITKLWDRWAELHYNKGVVDGSNMLTRLSAGELSLVEYNGLREKAAEKIPSAKDDLKQLVAEVVERSKKIQEWNDEEDDDDVAETG